jgi:hypothetical protein
MHRRATAHARATIAKLASCTRSTHNPSAIETCTAYSAILRSSLQTAPPFARKSIYACSYVSRTAHVHATIVWTGLLGECPKPSLEPEQIPIVNYHSQTANRTPYVTGHLPVLAHGIDRSLSPTSNCWLPACPSPHLPEQKHRTTGKLAGTAPRLSRLLTEGEIERPRQPLNSPQQPRNSTRLSSQQRRGC